VDSARAHTDLADLVRRLRTVTTAVQVLPFIYSAIYLVCMVLYLFCSDGVARLCDMLFYVSPVTVCAFLVLSRVLKMCVWHRTACVIPIAPQVVSLADHYVLELPAPVALITIIVTVILVALLLVAAYKVFVK